MSFFEYKNCLFTSESVTEGHPDKMADQISDAVLDAILEKDPHGRVACESLLTTGLVFVSGEITTMASPDIPPLVRRVVQEIGYDSDESGFDYKNCAVLTAVGRQSPDIALGVDGNGLHKEHGAGDQGSMFGYACDETPELMPASIAYSHALTRRLAECRKSGELPFLRPDGKSQVTVQYDDEGKIIRVHTVVLSSQHTPEVSHETLTEALREEVINRVIPASLLDRDTKYFINPTGRFVIGGPGGDCGLTGRKIIVDTYGGHGAHGGGAFSGKDPTKVDRSASYMARYIAKNIVSAGISRKCLVQLSYAIGVAEPVSLMIVCDPRTPASTVESLKPIVRELFGLKPQEIIERLELRLPIYRETAVYGHFGREPQGKQFSWEKTDKAETIKGLLKRN